MNSKGSLDIKALSDELKKRRRDIRNASRILKPLSAREPLILSRYIRDAYEPPAVVREQLQQSNSHLNAIEMSLRTVGISDETGKLSSTFSPVLARKGGGELLGLTQIKSLGLLMGELGKLVDQLSIFFEEVQAIPLPEDISVDKEKVKRLQEIKAVLEPHKKPRQVPRLDVPPGATWDSVIIRFISDDVIEIRAGKKPIGIKNFEELGFSDARKKKDKKRPNKQWGILTLFAEGGGEFSLDSLDEREQGFFKKRVSELGKSLKAVFGISGNPYGYYAGPKSYRTKFLISKKSELDSKPATDEGQSDLEAWHEELRRKYPKEIAKGEADDLRSIRSSKKTR